MEIITSLKKFHSLDEPCVIALGTFDGLHRGHQDVIKAAGAYAAEHNCRLAVFTFSNHPFSLIRPEAAPLSLIDSREKYELLADLGVELLLEVPFDNTLASLSPEDFLRQLQRLNFHCLAVGENFNFGYHGQGNIATLKHFAAKFNFHLIVRPLVSEQGLIVSSTEIRQLISSGNIELANKMLGRYYTLSGAVVQGNQRGRLLNFPTANIIPANSHAAVPHAGVYAVKARLADKVYAGMANIGINPTFGDVSEVRLETHIFAFDRNIYGCHLTVEFHKFIRNECKFASAKALQKQLLADQAKCKSFFAAAEGK